MLHVMASKSLLGAFLRGRAVDASAQEGQLDGIYGPGSYAEIGPGNPAVPPALKPTTWTTTTAGRGLGARLARAGSGSAVTAAVGMLLARMPARCADVSL